MQENIENYDLSNDSTNENFNEPTNIKINISEKFLAVAKWGRILSILGFIGLGVLMILALNAMFSMKEKNGYAGLIIAIVGVVSQVYIFPNYYLFKGSQNLQGGILDNDLAKANQGLIKMKSFYKFLVISTIVLLLGALIVYSYFFVSSGLI